MMPGVMRGAGDMSCRRHVNRKKNLMQKNILGFGEVTVRSREIRGSPGITQGVNNSSAVRVNRSR